MRFAIVDPAAQTVSFTQAADPRAAAPDIYRQGGVDHGIVKRDREGGVGIFVYEYGLLDGDGPYFALNDTLYAGRAVLYGFDARGESVDLDWTPEPVWLPTKADVELAIAAGVVERPRATFNGLVTWEWR